MIQGYGKLHNFNDLEGEILEAELVDRYAQAIAELQKVEKPDAMVEGLDEVIEQSEVYSYFSKWSLKRRIMERREEVLAKYKDIDIDI